MFAGLGPPKRFAQGMGAVMTVTGRPSCARTSSRLVTRQKSTMSAIARRDAAA